MVGQRLQENPRTRSRRTREFEDALILRSVRELGQRVVAKLERLHRHKPREEALF